MLAGPKVIDEVPCDASLGTKVPRKKSVVELEVTGQVLQTLQKSDGHQAPQVLVVLSEQALGDLEHGLDAAVVALGHHAGDSRADPAGLDVGQTLVEACKALVLRKPPPKAVTGCNERWESIGRLSHDLKDAGNGFVAMGACLSRTPDI